MIKALRLQLNRENELEHKHDMITRMEGECRMLKTKGTLQLQLRFKLTLQAPAEAPLNKQSRRISKEQVQKLQQEQQGQHYHNPNRALTPRLTTTTRMATCRLVHQSAAVCPPDSAR